jgi:hypothetical protein
MQVGHGRHCKRMLTFNDSVEFEMTFETRDDQPVNPITGDTDLLHKCMIRENAKEKENKRTYYALRIQDREDAQQESLEKDSFRLTYTNQFV